MMCTNKLLEEFVIKFVLYICDIKVQSQTVELIAAFPWKGVYCRVFEEGILRTLLEYSLRGTLWEEQSVCKWFGKQGWKRLAEPCMKPLVSLVLRIRCLRMLPKVVNEQRLPKVSIHPNKVCFTAVPVPGAAEGRGGLCVCLTNVPWRPLLTDLQRSWLAKTLPCCSWDGDQLQLFPKGFRPVFPAARSRLPRLLSRSHAPLLH